VREGHGVAVRDHDLGRRSLLHVDLTINHQPAGYTV
jgi:hypothetical protein